MGRYGADLTFLRPFFIFRYAWGNEQTGDAAFAAQYKADITKVGVSLSFAIAAALFRCEAGLCGRWPTVDGVTACISSPSVHAEFTFGG